MKYTIITAVLLIITFSASYYLDSQETNKTKNFKKQKPVLIIKSQNLNSQQIFQSQNDWINLANEVVTLKKELSFTKKEVVFLKREVDSLKKFKKEIDSVNLYWTGCTP